jgi:hypothetical protein
LPRAMLLGRGCGPILPGRWTAGGGCPHMCIAAMAAGDEIAGVQIAGVEDDVVAFAVAVGAGDAETEVRGFEDESEFGEFSAALGGEFALAGSLRDGLFGDRLLPGRPLSDRL